MHEDFLLCWTLTSILTYNKYSFFLCYHHVGVAISCLASYRVGVTLPTLQLPSSFSSSTGRPWLVPLTALPVVWRWAAALPALMAYVLLFMDQNITVRLVNSKEHKLKKGYGMHLDTMVIALLTVRHWFRA